MFCKNVVLHGHFVICICPCLVWIDVASIKHYSNAMKAKQSALNARNPWSAVGNPTSAIGPSGANFGLSSLAPIRIHHLLLSNLTTDNIKTWTGLPVEESVRMTEDRDKWRKYVYGVANHRIRMTEDGDKCKEQCQVHARPGWTTSRRGQESPWKSQSDRQRTEINGESKPTSMVRIDDG